MTHVATVPTDAATHPQLSHGALRTLIIVASYRHARTGLICPSERTIAQRLGVSRRTARGYIDELVRARLLARDGVTPGKRYGRRGRPAFRYRVLVRGEHKQPPKSGANLGGPEVAGGPNREAVAAQKGSKEPEEGWERVANLLRPHFGVNAEAAVERLRESMCASLTEPLEELVALAQRQCRDLLPATVSAGGEAPG